VQPDLSGNPFFGAGKSAEKKRLGAEGGNCCQILNIFNLFRSFRAICSHFTFT
jgi:hypothetical protein